MSGSARILLINPNTSQQTTELMARQARACLPAHVQLLTATARAGAPMITDEAGLRIAEQQVLQLGLEFADSLAADERVADGLVGGGSEPRQAIVVAAFGNPGLAQLRAHPRLQCLKAQASLSVWGIGEAALTLAAQSASGQPRRFGIATTTPGLEASIAQSVADLGLSACFSGTRIPPGEPLALAALPELQRERLAEAVAQCIELDGAQAVVIGGGPLAEAAQWLAPRFAVPVISPVAAAMQMALQHWAQLDAANAQAASRAMKLVDAA